MKDKTIGIMTKNVGQDRAEKFWALFVTRCCGGIEPAESDAFTREDVADAFKDNIPARNALIAAICGEQKEAPRGRKFKGDKARTYSPADLVSFIVADPKQDGLRDEVTRRTGGQPFRFVVDGKIAETETAERIRALYERDPVAPFVRIGNKDVEPVGYPTEDAKKDAEDPYEPGVALGQPGDVSSKLGMSLTGIEHETRQAIRCAVLHDLADASKRDLQRDAGNARGKTAAQYLADYPIASRKWATWPKPSLALERRNPPVAGAAETARAAGRVEAPKNGPVPMFFVLTGKEHAWDNLRRGLAALERTGTVRFVSDRDVPAGGFVSKWIADTMTEASGYVALLSNDTMNSQIAEAMTNSGKPLIPVVVRPCVLDLSPFAGKVVVCGDKPYSGDEDAMKVVQEVRRHLP